MYKMIYFILLLLAISVVSSLNDPKCGRLSNGCQIKSYFCNTKTNSTMCHFYVCDKIDFNFQFEQTEMDSIRNCSSNNPEVNEALFSVYFRLSKASILDGSFDLLNNDLFLTSTQNEVGANSVANNYEGIVGIKNKLTFKHIKGFDIGTFKPKNGTIRFDFYYSKVDFYLNRTLIRSCEDLENLNEIPQYVFNAFWPYYNDDISGLYDVRFYNCEYTRKICPLLIRLSQIAVLRFFGIQNTYYKSNYPRFLPVSNSSINLTYYLETPLELDLVNMQNIELNSDILNKFLFTHIYALRLFGDIVSVEKGLFKSFSRLRFIHLDLLSTRKLMHRGFDWMYDFNPGFQVDFNNLSVNFPYQQMCVKIQIYSYYEQGVISTALFNSYDTFPDEDFCLYSKLPLEKLILMFVSIFPDSLDDLSCTFILLIEYAQFLKNICFEEAYYLIYDMFEKQMQIAERKSETCNLKQRFVTCVY